MHSISEHLNRKLEQERASMLHRSPLPVMMLGTLGVVFGDIGTSPLYALKESFIQTGMSVTPENIFLSLSTFFCLLLFGVSVKNVPFTRRATNTGEGGDLALLALVL